jgi:polyisoprenoid-binding protein YceI
MRMFTGMLKSLALLALAAGAAAEAKTYEAIKGESSLSYGMVHPMHHITGVSRDFSCKVDLSPDTVSSQIKVSAAISSFDSKNSSRDSHAMEMVEAMKYPTVDFSSSVVKPEGDGYLVSGNLTFHGITRPVSFHVTPKSAAGKVEIIGEFAVKLSDYKVERPSLLFVPIEDKLTIRFDLFAKS